MRSKVYKDTAFNAIDYLSTLIIFLLTTNLLIKQLGADGYGFYMFFASLIGTFGLIDIGMGMAVSKYLSEFLPKKKYCESNQVITQAFLFYCVVGLLLLIIINALSSTFLSFLNFSARFNRIGSMALFVATVVFVVNFITSISVNILVALERWREISIINMALKSINCGVLVGILVSKINYLEKFEYIFVSILFFSLVKSAVYGWVSLRYFPQMRWVWPSLKIRVLIAGFLKWTSVQYALSLLVGHADKIIISRFFGLEILGVYSFTVNAFVYMYGFLTGLFKIYFPKLSKIHSENNVDVLMNYFKKLLFWAFLASLCIALTSILLWIPFISIYIGDDFAKKSFLYMVLFSAYLIVRSPEVIFSFFFNATANPVVLVRNVAVGSIATLGSYFVLVPIYSAYGLIIAQIIGSICIYTHVLFKIHRHGFVKFVKI